jgi:hypothetical protein
MKIDVNMDSSRRFYRTFCTTLSNRASELLSGPYTAEETTFPKSKFESSRVGTRIVCKVVGGPCFSSTASAPTSIWTGEGMWKSICKMGVVIALVFLICPHIRVQGVPTEELGSANECHCDEKSEACVVDGYVGKDVIYEDAEVRVWNFTLGAGEMTSMHRHDHDYHFVAIQPTQLEVWSDSGERLFDFRAEGVLGFKIVGEFLEPIGIELPWPVPRTHAAKNIGNSTYYEILYERK